MSRRLLRKTREAIRKCQCHHWLPVLRRSEIQRRLNNVKPTSLTKSCMAKVQSFLLLFLEIGLEWDQAVSRGMKCQTSGTGKHLAGLSLIARNMSIPVVRPIFIRKVPVGRVPIHKMRSCLASKGIARVARCLNFVLLLKLIFIQKFPRKTLRKTQGKTSPSFHSSETQYFPNPNQTMD
jgi:hypothetical protein